MEVAGRISVYPLSRVIHGNRWFTKRVGACALTIEIIRHAALLCVRFVLHLVRLRDVLKQKTVMRVKVYSLLFLSLRLEFNSSRLPCVA